MSAHTGGMNVTDSMIIFPSGVISRASSPLAQLYSTSTMEHHHFDQCLMILNSPGNQILANLSSEEYSRVIHVLEDAILSTDLAVYFRYVHNVKTHQLLAFLIRIDWISFRQKTRSIPQIGETGIDGRLAE